MMAAMNAVLKIFLGYDFGVVVDSGVDSGVGDSVVVGSFISTSCNVSQPENYFSLITTS